MAKYKVEFESVPVMYIESKTEEKLYDEVVEAWVMYSGYDLPDYQITEVKDKE